MLNKAKFTNYLILALLILSSGSVLNILGINNIIQTTLFVLVLIIAINKGVLKNIKNVSALLFILLSVLILFLLQAAEYGKLSIFFNNNNISIFLLIFTCLLVCFCFFSKPNFLLYLNSILYVYTLHAIISSVIISLFPTKNVLFTSADEGAKYVGHLYTFFQRVNVNYFGNLEPNFINYFGFELQRAHGLSWEPGNFSVYVNVFIFLNLYIFKNRRNVIIGVIGLVLAWSTSGLLVMLIQFSYFFIVNFNKFSAKNIIPKVLIGSVVSYVLVTATISNYNEKIYGDRSGSGASRFFNTASALYTIYNNPFIGTGFSFENYTNQLNKSISNSQSITSSYVDSSSLDKVASTNSFLRIYVQFGIPIGLFFTICLFKQTLIPSHKFIFAVIIIVSTSSAPLMMTPFYFLFVISGFLAMLEKKKPPIKYYIYNDATNLKKLP
jgi:hypothetical protein